MGLGTSKPSCGITRRSLLNVENAAEIVKSCSRNRLAYIWGILLVVTAALLVGYFNTRQYSDEEFPRKNFYVPFYICLVPLVFGIIYTAGSWNSEDIQWKAEELEFSLSGMPKKEYLQYRIGDDRANKSFLGTATSAGILAGTNILGPTIRADR